MEIKEKNGKNQIKNNLSKKESYLFKTHNIFMKTSPDKFNFSKFPSSVNKNENKPKNISKLPPLNSILFNDIIANTNQPQTNSNAGLQKTLLDNRIFLNQKKKELQDLKIQCNKLNFANKNSQNLIKKIMCLEDKNITTDELIFKIKTIQISDAQYNKLKESLTITELRSKINEKKKILLSKINEYEYLKDNSTFRNINELYNEINKKEIETINLKNDIEKLNEIYEKNNQIISELLKNLEIQSKNLENLNERQNENQNRSKSLRQQINDLIQQIKCSESNINIQKFKNMNKTNNNQNLKRDINLKEIQIQRINEYRQIKDSLISQINKKQTKVKDQKEKNSLLENEINNLMNENHEIYSKVNKYKEENKKLENKSHEPIREIRRMEQLQKNLTELKEIKNNLLIINKAINEKNKENEDEIKNCKEQKEKLEIQKNELEKNLNEINDEIEKIKENIKNKKNEYDKLTEELKLKNEEELRKKEKDNENYEKIKKQRKTEIEGLKNKKEKLSNENENVSKNNKKLNQEIEQCNNEIQKYTGVNDRLIDAKLEDYEK